MLNYPRSINDGSGKRWYTCNLCGGSYDEVEIPYKLGITAPIVGQVLTGVISGSTAVVDNVKLISGSWDDGTAAGIIWCTSPVGFDSDTGHWGSRNELVTGI